MKTIDVKLLTKTPNMLDVIYTAARTCYSKKTPQDIWEEIGTIDTEKKLALVKKVIGSGHESTAEHVYVTFALTCDRATSLQLVRHRHCSFSQASQRYIEIKEDKQYLNQVLDRGESSELLGVANNYFIVDNLLEARMTLKALISYRTLIEAGEAPEDARKVLPNCTKTNMVVSMNLRELKLICSLRLCQRAQKPIRTMVKKMRDLLVAEEPWLNKFLQPKCVQNGNICGEDKSCGFKPTIKQIMSSELHKINAEVIQEELRGEI